MKGYTVRWSGGGGEGVGEGRCAYSSLRRPDDYRAPVPSDRNR